jgi:hypothetical protein
MAAKRMRIMEEEDIAQELFLDSDSGTHTSEDELSPHESDNEKEGTQKDNTQ